MAGILHGQVLFCVFMDGDEVFLRDTVGSPKLHLARLQSQPYNKQYDCT